MTTLDIKRKGDRIWSNEEGDFHREDGPAIEYDNGLKMWLQNDKLHREDGPAIEYGDGDNEWWLDGKNYTEAEFKELIQI